MSLGQEYISVICIMPIAALFHVIALFYVLLWFMLSGLSLLVGVNFTLKCFWRSMFYNSTISYWLYISIIEIIYHLYLCHSCEAWKRMANIQKAWSRLFSGTVGSVLWNCIVFWPAEHGMFSTPKRTKIYGVSLSSLNSTTSLLPLLIIERLKLQYVEPVVDRLDPKHCIRYRLSRGATRYVDGKHYRVHSLTHLWDCLNCYVM